MIFIFYNNHYRPHRDWKTQSKKRNICMVFCTLFLFSCLFVFIVITKRKNIYNNNHKKDRFRWRFRNITTGKQSQHSTSTYLLQEMKGTKMKQKQRSGKGKIKGNGTYEVEYNKRPRGRESLQSMKEQNKKSQNKGCFLAFFPFLFIKK